RLEFARRSFDEKFAVRVLDVFRRRLEQVPGDDLRFLPDLPERAHESAAADRRRTAAVASPAHGSLVGISVEHLDAFDRNAELTGNDLRECRLLTLAVRGDAYHHVDFAGWVKTHDRALPEAAAEADRAGDLRRPQSTDLRISREADAQILAFLAKVGLLSPQR